MKTFIVLCGLLFGVTATSFSQFVNVRNVTGCPVLEYEFELITNTSTCGGFLASSGAIYNCNTFVWQLNAIYQKYRFRYRQPGTISWSNWYGNVPGCVNSPGPCYSELSICNGASSVYSYPFTSAAHNYVIFHGNSCSQNDCY